MSFGWRADEHLSTRNCSNAQQRMENSVKKKHFRFYPNGKPKSTPRPLNEEQDAETQEAAAAIPIITIERPVQHIDKRLSFYRVHFKDLEGNPDKIDILRKSFGKPTEVAEALLNSHAQLPINAAEQKACITQALEQMSTKSTLMITDRLGWNSSGDSYVYFDATYGPASETLQLDQDPNRNPALGQRKGTVEAWRTGLEKPCAISDELIFSISVAASGPLYGIMPNWEPAIYHFQGAKMPAGDPRVWKSSSGKTLCARGGRSMFGECSRIALNSFNMTRVAVEEICYSCNNLLVELDEEGTAGETGTGQQFVDPNVLPYLIVGGQGRKRSRSYSQANGLGNRSWVTPVITTSEDELDAGKSKRKEGSAVRMVAIPFAPTWQGGTFSTAASKSERKKLVALTETTIAENFGVAMPIFLQKLVAARVELVPEVDRIRDAFVDEVGASGNSWEKRFAEKFGAPFAAATLMVRFGIAPFTEERAKAAIRNVYRSSRSITVSVPQATDAVLARLTKLVAAGTRFPKVAKGQSIKGAQKTDAWGIIRDVGGKKNVTVIKPERFEKLVEPSAVSDAVLLELAERGVLLKDPEGNLRCQVLAKGLSEKRHRYVCLRHLVKKKVKATKA
jgi:Domain of unknown function (DUF927)